MHRLCLSITIKDSVLLDRTERHTSYMVQGPTVINTHSLKSTVTQYFTCVHILFPVTGHTHIPVVYSDPVVLSSV